MRGLRGKRVNLPPGEESCGMLYRSVPATYTQTGRGKRFLQGASGSDWEEDAEVSTVSSLFFCCPTLSGSRQGGTPSNCPCAAEWDDAVVPLESPGSDPGLAELNCDNFPRIMAY